MALTMFSHSAEVCLARSILASVWHRVQRSCIRVAPSNETVVDGVALDAPDEHELTKKITASKHKNKVRVRIFKVPPKYTRVAILYSYMAINGVGINE